MEKEPDWHINDTLWFRYRYGNWVRTDYMNDVIYIQQAHVKIRATFSIHLPCELMTVRNYLSLFLKTKSVRILDRNTRWRWWCAFLNGRSRTEISVLHRLIWEYIVSVFSNSVEIYFHEFSYFIHYFEKKRHKIYRVLVSTWYKTLPLTYGCVFNESFK